MHHFKSHSRLAVQKQVQARAGVAFVVLLLRIRSHSIHSSFKFDPFRSFRHTFFSVYGNSNQTKISSQGLVLPLLFYCCASDQIKSIQVSNSIHSSPSGIPSFLCMATPTKPTLLGKGLCCLCYFSAAHQPDQIQTNGCYRSIVVACLPSHKSHKMQRGLFV